MSLIDVAALRITHKGLRPYMHMCMSCTCMHVHVHAHVHAHAHAHVHVHVHVHVLGLGLGLDMQMCMHMCMCMQSHVHVRCSRGVWQGARGEGGACLARLRSRCFQGLLVRAREEHLGDFESARLVLREDLVVLQLEGDTGLVYNGVWDGRGRTDA